MSDIKLFRIFAGSAKEIQGTASHLEYPLHPDQVNPVEGFTRDVRKIGQWGTGSVEVTLRTSADLEEAKPLLLEAYEGDSRAG